MNCAINLHLNEEEYFDIFKRKVLNLQLCFNTDYFSYMKVKVLSLKKTSYYRKFVNISVRVTLLSFLNMEIAEKPIDEIVVSFTKIN